MIGLVSGVVGAVAAVLVDRYGKARGWPTWRRYVTALVLAIMLILAVVAVIDR